MELNTDTILLFLGGMILGGFLFMRAEAYVLERFYPDIERTEALKKTGFILTFAGVFCFVLVFFLWKSAFPSGICAGFAIFGIRP